MLRFWKENSTTTGYTRMEYLFDSPSFLMTLSPCQLLSHLIFPLLELSRKLSITSMFVLHLQNYTSVRKETRVCHEGCFLRCTWESFQDKPCFSKGDKSVVEGEDCLAVNNSGYYTGLKVQIVTSFKQDLEYTSGN